MKGISESQKICFRERLFENKNMIIEGSMKKHQEKITSKKQFAKIITFNKRFRN